MHLIAHPNDDNCWLSNDILAALTLLGAVIDCFVSRRLRSWWGNLQHRHFAHGLLVLVTLLPDTAWKHWRRLFAGLDEDDDSSASFMKLGLVSSRQGLSEISSIWYTNSSPSHAISCSIRVARYWCPVQAKLQDRRWCIRHLFWHCFSRSTGGGSCQQESVQDFKTAMAAVANFRVLLESCLQSGSNFELQIMVASAILRWR
jgi:hypothetical protein